MAPGSTVTDFTTLLTILSAAGRPALSLSLGRVWVAADKMVNNVVKSVTVEQGAIHILFGNRANGALQGKTLTLRPAVVEGEPLVPVAWVCGHAKPPEKMTALGTDRTDIARGNLPVNCL